jgi:hypothetical protein
MENCLDVNQQRCVADPAACLKRTRVSCLTRAILVKAAGADIQRATLRRHRPDLAMSLDKGVSHRDSLAKYAAAFLRNGLVGSRDLCCLQNESEGLGAPMKIFDDTFPITGLVV